MKKALLAILLVLLVMAFTGCKANPISNTTTQNKSKAVKEIPSPAQTKEAVKKSTEAVKKVEVDLTAIDTQLDSIGDFDIIDEINLD